MKNLLPVLCSIVIIFSLSILGCQKDEVVAINQVSHNATVISNVPNAFSFVVDAQKYNYSDKLPLQINADTLTIAITITGHSTGSGSMVIKDDSSAVIYQKDLSNAMVSVDVVNIVTVPKTIDITLSNYTGKITLAVAGR